MAAELQERELGDDTAGPFPCACCGEGGSSPKPEMRTSDEGSVGLLVLTDRCHLDLVTDKQVNGRRLPLHTDKYHLSNVNRSPPFLFFFASILLGRRNSLHSWMDDERSIRNRTCASCVKSILLLLNAVFSSVFQDPCEWLHMFTFRHHLKTVQCSM
jgi:hypothetical protein